MMLLQAGQIGLYRRESIITDALPPNMVSGCTLWIDCTDTSTLWSGNDLTGSNVTTNGDPVGSALNIANTANYFTVGSYYPELINPGVNGQSAIKISGSSDMRASASAPISNYVTSTTKLIVVAVKINSAPADMGTVYQNPVLFGDENAYLGLHYYDAGGGNVTAQAYNYGASVVASAERNFPFGEYVILSMSHQSSQLRLRVNGGAWGTVSSGTTDLMTSIAAIGTGAYHTGTGREFEFAHLATFNTAQTDAGISAIEHWLATDCAITPWW